MIVSPSAIGTWFLFCQPLLACFSHCMGTVLDFRVVHIVLICGTVLASELCKFSCLRGFVSKICLRNCILCSVFHSFCSCVHFAVFQVSVAGVLAGSEKYAPKTVLSVLCSILSFCFVCSVTLFMFMLPGFSRVCCRHYAWIAHQSFSHYGSRAIWVSQAIQRNVVQCIAL